MRISASLPTGVTALLFEEARRRRALEVRLASALEAAGYGEVVLPILDYFEPYETLLSRAAESELYRFVDRDGALLLLRADFTPMLARLLAPRLASLELPLRLFYRGDVVRYQEERPGRMREFYQLGAELIGAGGAEADEEVLRLFVSQLSAAGAGDVQVVIGFAGALDALLATLPKSERGDVAAAVARRERGAVREASPVLAEIVEQGAPRDPASLGTAAAQSLARLRALVASLAPEFPRARLTIDLAELAPTLSDSDRDAGGYYDGLLFRAYAGDHGLPVAAGGRYDSLFDRLGCRVPAAGFSLGLDRLAGGEQTETGARALGSFGELDRRERRPSSQEPSLASPRLGPFAPGQTARGAGKHGVSEHGVVERAPLGGGGSERRRVAAPQALPERAESGPADTSESARAGEHGVSEHGVVERAPLGGGGSERRRVAAPQALPERAESGPADTSESARAGERR